MNAMARKAFTLVELLTVMAIIAILTVLALPALTSLSESGRLTQATSMVSGALNKARQFAASNNTNITFRFIRDRLESGSPFRILQILGPDNGGTLRLLTKTISLPTGIAFAEDPTLSSLLSSPDLAKSEQAASASDPVVPGLGSNYRYVEFQFRPDGRLNQKIANKWFATLMLAKLGTTTPSAPSNFVTFQIDPVNGNVLAIQR